MIAKYLVLFVALFINQYALANINKKSSDTIPFVLYKTHLVASTQGQAQNFNTVNAASTSNIPIAEVQSLILQIRKAVCNGIGKGQVRVWVSIDASGKLLGVGASTQSGLEITFDCM